ncbi:MAG: hypothetical protein AAF502_08460 [Bacteroidota bacterium]
MANKTANDSFLERVIMYLDGELTKQEERELLLEIKETPEYLEKFKIEKSFREFIRSKITRRSVSQNLIQNIKDQIRTRPS